MLKKYIGTKAFYKMVLAIALPIMIQNGFTNFVNMLDNLMVGRVGTDQMSGVAIVNQLLFVYNLSVFGGISGAGIFTAQYFGKNDKQGVKNVFKIKIFIAFLIAVVGVSILYFYRIPLISHFLHEGSVTGNLDATLAFAEKYILIMLIGLVPFTINQCYISTLRETGETMAPMYGGIVAVVVNLCLNYLLIFGKLGFPKLGVEGAAIATVISRFAECVYILVWTGKHSEKHSFANKLYRDMKIPKELLKNVAIKGTPLMINEFLWAAGMTAQAQCYSTRGLATVAGINICNTLANVFNIVFIALGSSVAIIIGQLLGAGKLKEAKETDRKLIAFSVASCVLIAAVMVVAAPLFPKFYQTADEVKELAKWFIIIVAVLMPVDAFTHAAYFTLRSGGKTGITFLFDSGYMWVVGVPIAYILSHFTKLMPVELFFWCQLQNILKAAIGFALVKGGSWANNIVKD